jgi:hypothetical protein
VERRVRRKKRRSRDGYTDTEAQTEGLVVEDDLGSILAAERSLRSPSPSGLADEIAVAEPNPDAPTTESPIGQALPTDGAPIKESPAQGDAPQVPAEEPIAPAETQEPPKSDAIQGQEAVRELPADAETLDAKNEDEALASSEVPAPTDEPTVAESEVSLQLDAPSGLATPARQSASEMGTPGSSVYVSVVSGAGSPPLGSRKRVRRKKQHPPRTDFQVQATEFDLPVVSFWDLL